jgi:hypothetical protein
VAILVAGQWSPIVILILISLVTDHIEYLSMTFLATWVSFPTSSNSHFVSFSFLSQMGFSLFFIDLWFLDYGSFWLWFMFFNCLSKKS